MPRRPSFSQRLQQTGFDEGSDPGAPQGVPGLPRMGGHQNSPMCIGELGEVGEQRRGVPAAQRGGVGYRVLRHHSRVGGEPVQPE
jgi:hypothetical protein